MNKNRENFIKYSNDLSSFACRKRKNKNSYLSRTRFRQENYFY